MTLLNTWHAYAQVELSYNKIFEYLIFNRVIEILRNFFNKNLSVLHNFEKKRQ